MLSCDLVHLLSQIAVLGVKSRHVQRLAHKLQYMRKKCAHRRDFGLLEPKAVFGSLPYIATFCPWWPVK